MRSEAVLAVRDGRIATLNSQAPIVLVPQQRFGRRITVHVVMSAAGPLDGDDLRLHVMVGEGQEVVLRSVAATVVLSGTSSMRLDADVEGRLSWLPEPTIVTRHANHTSMTTVHLGSHGHVRVRDTIILGRFGEEPGTIYSGIDVTRGSRPILRHAVKLPGPPVVAPCRVIASDFDTESDGRASLGPGRRATMPLATEGALTVVLADNALGTT